MKKEEQVFQSICLQMHKCCSTAVTALINTADEMSTVMLRFSRVVFNIINKRQVIVS